IRGRLDRRPPGGGSTLRRTDRGAAPGPPAGAAGDGPAPAARLQLLRRAGGERQARRAAGPPPRPPHRPRGLLTGAVALAGVPGPPRPWRRRLPGQRGGVSVGRGAADVPGDRTGTAGTGGNDLRSVLPPTRPPGGVKTESMVRGVVLRGSTRKDRKRL